jgi:hypothetical protein
MLIAGLLGWAGGAAHAQPVSPSLRPADGIPSNFVQVLHAEGDSLWIGPLLHLTTDGGETFAVAEADSLIGSRNQVFALDVEGQLLWAGLAFGTGSGGSGAGGFLFSTDGGETFTYRFPPLDGPSDTTVTYGGNTLPALPITTEENSAPTGIDAVRSSGIVWSANGIGGLRRSADQGETWQRVVLPPDDRNAIFPDSTYDFVVGPPSTNGGSLNHVGFSVLVDETGTVWAGTAAGVNRSAPSDVRPNGRVWRRFAYDGTPAGLTGNRVVAIAEQPQPGRNPIWMATWSANQTAADRQRFGVTVTRDGGETFETVLVGTRTFGFAFHDETVYVAGGSLYISDDGGQSWRTVRSFPLADASRFLPNDPGVRAVATTSDALWVGTEEGLLRQRFGEDTWTLFRADVPLDPELPTEDVPRVDTYAYPNPFSPAADRVVRIRYPLKTPRDVEVQIFDFNMNLVRRIVDDAQPTGSESAAETVWDGTDSGGLRVPNGPYFYTVEVGDQVVRGKILLIE